MLSPISFTCVPVLSIAFAAPTFAADAAPSAAMQPSDGMMTKDKMEESDTMLKPDDKWMMK